MYISITVKFFLFNKIHVGVFTLYNTTKFKIFNHTL